MLKIGITGSIGSGKTTVCKILETLQVPVYYADERGKWLQQYDPVIKEKVKKVFGENIYGTNGILDKALLASIVFNEPKKLSILESIVHPAVKNDFQVWFGLQNTSYIVKEAALLFEADTYKELDKIITVSSPLETRIKRVLARDHASREQVMARMDRQWPDEKKIEMADYVVYNHDGQLLLPQILRLHEIFKSMAIQSVN